MQSCFTSWAHGVGIPAAAFVRKAASASRRNAAADDSGRQAVSTGPNRLLSGLLIAGCLCLAICGTAHGQLALLKRLDPDGDGVVQRDKLSGRFKMILDRMIDRYGLDKKKKEWKLEELRAAIESGAKKRLEAEQSSSGSTGPGVIRRQAGGKTVSIPPHKPGELHPLVSLPEQYGSYDKDNDGQIGLYEWPRKRIAEFLKLDKNDDGFLTIEELGKPEGKQEGNGGDTKKEGEKREERKEQPQQRSVERPERKPEPRSG